MHYFQFIIIITSLVTFAMTVIGVVKAINKNVNASVWDIAIVSAVITNTLFVLYQIIEKF